MYENKTLICEDCKNEFIFTAEEQEFYASKGAEALQGLPRCKKERSKTAERVLHHHLRKMRQGSKSTLPADQRQTCLLQRLLRSNEGRTVIKNLQTRIRVFIA